MKRLVVYFVATFFLLVVFSFARQPGFHMNLSSRVEQSDCDSPKFSDQRTYCYELTEFTRLLGNRCEIVVRPRAENGVYFSMNYPFEYCSTGQTDHSWTSEGLEVSIKTSSSPLKIFIPQSHFVGGR